MCILHTVFKIKRVVVIVVSYISLIFIPGEICRQEESACNLQGSCAQHIGTDG